MTTAVFAGSACNTSGSAGNGAPGGVVVAGPATIKGAVQSLSGGVVVNGVTFRTSGARISDDGGASSTLSGEAIDEAELEN